MKIRGIGNLADTPNINQIARMKAWKLKRDGDERTLLEIFDEQLILLTKSQPK